MHMCIFIHIILYINMIIHVVVLQKFFKEAFVVRMVSLRLPAASDAVKGH